MIVGHNPTLSELVSLLVVGARRSPICELKKGASPPRAPTGASGLYDRLWFAPPRLLRRLGGAGGDDD